ncbi:MAG: hypothetical protein ACRC1K_24710 [Planctomycetia bacterium]
MGFRQGRYLKSALGGLPVVALAGVLAVGCSVDAVYHGDLAFPFWFPVPVPQLIGDNIQDWKTKVYNEVPIMPPVRDYAPVLCLDPPAEYDVIREMKKPSHPGNIPYLRETHYNNMQIVVEKLVDSIDECRFYPLLGPAQLHHCHYKVTIYFDRIRHSMYPFSWEVTDKDVEVLYIDKDHLHICTSPEMEDIPESYRDIYGTY